MKTVNPTRMNLLLKRDEVNTAQTGVSLLRSKRDVLLKEFFTTLKTLLLQREGLDKQAYEATRSLVYALGLEGREKLSSQSLAKTEPPCLEISYRNIWGVKIPEINIEQKSGEGEVVEGLAIKEARDNFSDFLYMALRTLPQELKLKRIGQEIKNTTRKVNSLEKYIVPQLRSQIKYIRETLEEREREDIFRLKRLKKKEAVYV